MIRALLKQGQLCIATVPGLMILPSHRLHAAAILVELTKKVHKSPPNTSISLETA